MTPIRVLLVDDSAITRRLVGDALAADPALTLVGTAANGLIALTKVERLRPDVVVLDIEMPEMDGLATLVRIRDRHPEIRVLMFSQLTERGASATLDALSLGAVDYVTKPSAAPDAAAALRSVREPLIEKIKAVCGRAPAPAAAPSRTRAHAPLRRLLAPAAAPEIVAVAASTGGPDALTRLLRGLPKSLPVPVVVVQHMPPIFTRLFCQRLDAQVALPVREAQDGMAAHAGEVYVAPGDQHMVVVREGAGTRLKTHRGPPENSCRPAADVLFRSAAAAFGSGVVAVVLTGMGRDGLQGSSVIREHGGVILAQDRESAVVWGMPGHVAESGLCDELGRPEQLAVSLAERLAGRRAGCP